ncbi:hypothetical protein DC363_01900 [Thalassorhabdomicrobium marinisediminis]|uniref:histidine kinase n=1 Tax=Thalassorhabdomicrobium marinisediminis TaxID=2170577 RepID=A0A2T7G1I2_9RHOB|nr:hypothetical protein DC363_01900 [Thalassorhabdomicrobium marinisediminis]
MIVLPIALFAIAYKVDDLIRENYDQDLRLSHTFELVEARAEVEKTMVDHFLSLGRLAALVEANPQLDQSQFEELARAVARPEDLVINYAAAPDLVVEFVHPLDRNQAAIGLDYAANDQQRDGVTSALDNRAAVVVGPIDLVQGGRGLILRQPVFAGAGGSGGSRRLWGVVSLVLDYDAFWDASGVMELAADYQLFVTSDFNGDGVDEAVFGDPQVAGANPIELAFQFPTGSWTLMAVPRPGWPAGPPDATRNRLVMALISAILIASVLTIGALALLHLTSRKRLSAAVEAMNDGFAMFDSERRLIAYNKRYAEIYDNAAEKIRQGTTFDEIITLAAEHGMHVAALGREDEWVQERIASFDGPDTTFEQELCSGRHLLASDRSLEDGGKVCLRTDITELKHAQEKAEAASKAKSEFINTLSHELRTPLTVILGVSGLLKQADRLGPVRALMAELERDPVDAAATRAATEAVFAQFRDMLDKQERSARQMLDLVNDVLDMAKVESGSYDFNLARHSTQDIIDHVHEQMIQRAHAKGLELIMPPASGHVYCDKLRTTQILLNLVGNAIKFTEAGRVTLSVQQTDSVVSFEVSDTGQGISAGDQQHIFEAFKQLDSSDIRAHGGVGLGLAISRQLAQLQNGTLEVSSELGAGSSFVLRLPERAPEADGLAADKADGGPVGRHAA